MSPNRSLSVNSAFGDLDCTQEQASTFRVNQDCQNNTGSRELYGVDAKSSLSIQSINANPYSNYHPMLAARSHSNLDHLKEVERRPNLFPFQQPDTIKFVDDGEILRDRSQMQRSMLNLIQQNAKQPRPVIDATKIKPKGGLTGPQGLNYILNGSA